MMKVAHFAIAAWGLCLGTVVLAAETSKETTTTTTTTSADGKVIMIKTHKHVGAGGPSRTAVMSRCDGEKQLVRTEVDQSQGPSRRVHIVMCKDGNASPADTAARLATARQKIADDQSLSADIKSRILKDLDEEIVRQSGKGEGG